MTPDERMDALAATMQELAATVSEIHKAHTEAVSEMQKAHTEAEKMIQRMGRYAMVIARIHENELADHHKRLLALEEEIQ